ncbi:PBECR2 nuclease fold domain-containing protein, partial [Campylobacter upsaliensis]|uniref:PBECR2 nuclease fold domain-containing protein n=1 Tax=Campylobacter upsaliensis TaxID=28080 RepID=UPI00214A419C
EVIEEIGLNEPMKFLEFQQKKLLTYIKQNTPLRLLERKIELKTRDILNFLEQSALNGKEKAFLMRNFERDLGKIELKIKEKESVKEKIKNAKTSPYPQNADEVVRIQSISKQELEQSNPQQSHLSTKESIAENSQEAKIKEAVKNYNAFYKTLPEYYGDEVGEELMIRQKELIENLAKDKKVQAFTSQWNHPFKKDGNLKGIGIHYKAKAYGKGVNKTMYVDGGGFGSATQQKKEKRLLELEKERLYAAFKADFGIDGFISKYAENEFFRALWQKASAYKGIDYGWGVYPEKYYPYYENRIMPSDTITQAKEKLKNELKRIEKESVKESETIDNVKQSLFNEEANFKANFEYETQEAKQKTINKVDAYAKSEAFKALSKDKQEAILSLKSIKPGIMPENIKIQDLQHLQEHFKGKLDEKQREKFLSLFNDTKQNADLVLEVLKNGEKRQEYIKAYQHKESKDLYYIAISKNERDITGIPTTQIQKIINDIAKSERVIKAENFGEISNTAAPLPKQTSPQRSNESIAQKAKRNFTKREKKLNKVLNLSENEDKIIKEGFFETYGETSFGEKSLRQSIEENELYVKKLLTQLKELESIDKQSKQYALKLKELDKNIGDYWDNFVSKDLLYSFRETQNYADHGEKVRRLRKWGQEKFQSLQNAFKEQIREPFEVLKKENANLSKNVESKNEALNRAQKAWLEAFGLKSIEEAYTPKFSKEVNEALEKVLNGEQIKLTKGSYEKLVKRDREEFLPFIKETLENADAVVKQADGALIFAKDYRNEKLGKFFASVSRNDKGEWVITSNAPKTLNNLKNKIEEGGELLYSDLPELPIIAKPKLTAEALNGEANLSESIAQNPDYLELVKEYGEENAKKIIKQKILSENIAQVLESGEEKF